MGVSEAVIVAVMMEDNLVVAIQEACKAAEQVETVAAVIRVVVVVEAVVQTAAM